MAVGWMCGGAWAGVGICINVDAFFPVTNVDALVTEELKRRTLEAAHACTHIYTPGMGGGGEPSVASQTFSEA